MYYNPTTTQVLSRQELKKFLNASIPKNTEEINGWYLIHNDTLPEITEGQSIVPDQIIFNNNQYIQTYRVIGTATNQPIITYEERLSALEAGLADLAQLYAERF